MDIVQFRAAVAEKNPEKFAAATYALVHQCLNLFDSKFSLTENSVYFSSLLSALERAHKTASKWKEVEEFDKFICYWIETFVQNGVK